jgi:hypothetical protein
MIKVKKILLFLSLLINCKFEELELANNITLEKITKSSQLGEGAGTYYLSLEFKDDNFEFRYSSEGWNWYTEGKFNINNSKLFLSANKCEDNFGNYKCDNSFGNGFCQISDNKESIEFIYKLDCFADKNFIIFNSEAKPSNLVSFDIQEYKIKSGTEKIFNNIPIVTLGNAQGKVLEPVVLREKPGIQYPKIDYVVNNYDGPIYSSLPTNTMITIHARTKNRDSVKNWNNFWLLISSGDTRKVWVYGEFISY